MKLIRTAVLATAVTGALAASTALSGLAAAAAPPEQATQAPPPTTRDDMQWAVGPASSVPKGEVQPAALDALASMSRFLQSLSAAQLVAAGSLDVVNVQGQRVQIDGITTIRMKRRGFLIHHVNDLRSRDFYYDGKQFTMVSPALNFYATVPAPASNHEVLEMAYTKYGIRLPLEDFLHWATPGGLTEQFISAFAMGPSLQAGINTTHYVFRDAQLDWEIWIANGPQPLPLKLSIVDRTNPARPAFTARLSWSLNPVISDDEFKFKPGVESKPIEMASYKG